MPPNNALQGTRRKRRAPEGGRWASQRKQWRIRKSVANDFEAILAIINDAAQAYRGVIPSDRWHEPYVGRRVGERDCWWRHLLDGGGQWAAAGRMGIQDKEDVALVRHAYTATTLQRKGIRNKAASSP